LILPAGELFFAGGLRWANDKFFCEGHARQVIGEIDLYGQWLVELVNNCGCVETQPVAARKYPAQPERLKLIRLNLSLC
jgi:hypothetical protein